MIIKSLELHNFRQFMENEYGEGQRITFSTDSNKKATLLIAKNATGKTTLLQSFSWVLYGEANGLKTVINIDMQQNMHPGDEKIIKGIIILEHLGIDYVIERMMKIKKISVNIKKYDSELKINYTDKDGNNKELKGIEADNIINEIVPKDLFSYFFFQGENIETIGQEISSGKASEKSEFVKAIKGMLGFNWLYAEQKHLKAVIKDYQQEIASNSTDKKTQELQKKINSANENIEKYTKDKELLEKSLEEFKNKKEEISNQIIRNGDVSEKQQETLQLKESIEHTAIQLSEKKKNLFTAFSSEGYRLLSKNLLLDTLQFLKENGGDISKGVLGIEARAIRDVLDGKLDNGKCFCGQNVSDLSASCKDKLESLIKYLPPNNLGIGIRGFESTAKIRIQGGDELFKRHKELIKDITDLEMSIEVDKKKKNDIDEAIKNFPDMAKKKSREQELEKNISKTHQDIGRIKELIKNNKNDKASAEKEKEGYRSKDERVRKLTKYEKQANNVYKYIKLFCEKKEKEKKKQLQQAINDIFSEVFDVSISMELDENYNMHFRNEKNSNIEEFQSSTSQDAILAFSFIGGIIKLARESVAANAKIKSDDEVLSNIIEVEPYPLVMDAPSSSFDIDRIKSFCRVMPSIAEQVIFFIKDTDGNYVRDNIKDIIGVEYTMEKTEPYKAIIREVR